MSQKSTQSGRSLAIVAGSILAIAVVLGGIPLGGASLLGLSPPSLIVNIGTIILVVGLPLALLMSLLSGTFFLASAARHDQVPQRLVLIDVLVVIVSVAVAVASLWVGSSGSNHPF